MINLLVSYDPARNTELVECLRRNLANPYIAMVHLFDETDSFDPAITNSKLRVVRIGHRVTFQDLFRYANIYLPKQTCAIASPGVFFDYSLSELQNYSLKNTLLCLSRWDEQPDGSSIHFNRPDSQDAWIFFTPIPAFPSNWRLGIPGSENRLAFEAKQAGMKLRNPSLFIRARRLHASVRDTEADRLDGSSEQVPIDANRPMKSDGIAVSAVCLTTYPKRAGMLDEAIASFMAQSFSGEKELIIVNDGVPLRSLYPDTLMVVNVEPGLTIGDKRNIGSAYGRGQTVATWDDDDISLENRLEDEFRILNDTGAGYVKSESMWVADGNLRIKGLLKSPSFGTSMVRADVLKKVGGFPEVSWAEDMELFIRIRLRGIPIMVLKDPFYVYRKHGSNVSTQTIKEGLDRVVAASDRRHPGIANAQARVDRILSTKKTYVQPEGSENHAA